jgi:Putative restriction endonuclease
MLNTADKLMSLDEFLAWEHEQPERYEYAGGVVTMMTGGSAAHVTIALNLAIALRHALRGTGCRPFASDMKVIANDTARYPDISVTCHPVGDRDDNISHPVLVIEVISPPSGKIVAERNSITSRLHRSSTTPSLSRMHGVSTSTPDRVDRWTNEIIEGDAVLRLSSIGVEISLDTVYEDTELDATRLRESGRQAPAL